MAKNNLDNVEVVEDAKVDEQAKELQAVEIAHVKEDKPLNPIMLVLFFAILIGFVFGLPYIEDWVNKLKGNEVIEPTPDPTPQPDPDPGEAEDTTTYAIDTANFRKGDLIFSNFYVTSTGDFMVKFKISTDVDKEINLDEFNYYLEMYSSEKTLLERIKLTGNHVIKKDSTTIVEYNIKQNTFNNTRQVRVALKQTSDYPEVTLNKNEAGNQILTCSDGDHKLIYTFTDNKLNQIDDSNTYNRSTNNDEYTNTLNTKRSEVASLNNKEGVSSTLVETTTGFIINTVVSTSTADIAALSKEYYFINDTLAKAIKFEMEAMRYSCY